MKVIIVEVTRAANTFGRLHLDKIREAYDADRRDRRAARADGSFKSGHLGRVRGDVLLRRDRAAAVGAGSSTCSRARDEEFEHAKLLVVEAICAGLEAEPKGASALSG